MDRKEFLEQFQDVLQREEELSFDMLLKDIEEWDSLALMTTSAFLDKNFGLRLTFADFKSFETVEDIAKRAGL